MWLPKEGNFILLFSNKKISKSGISAWATTRGRPYEIIFMQPNNNLPVCFLLGHPGKPIPEYFPGSGVAMRQTIIYRRLTVTVNYSFFIFHSSFRRKAPHFARRLGAAKPHIFRAVSTENNKTAGFVSRRPTAG